MRNWKHKTFKYLFK